jgi:5S rRNA maturation endonuclease (ribonuclease M5)
MQRADELERFKSQINLAEYAEAQGYEIDRRESSRASTVMRSGGDKIIVATDTDGHGIYFSVRDDADHGSIIDFVQKRQGLNLGQVRKELRPWIGDRPEQRQRVQRKPEAERPRKPEPSSADRQQVLAVWMKMQPAQGRHPYLERERKLKPETLADPRFVGMVRIDGRGNAAFPHYDRQGLAGFELKNQEFTGFSRNGQKAVWHSANLATASRVVLVESAIDAMSHAQLSGDREAAYLSTGGSMSDHQRELVRSALTKATERGAEIVIATDADEPGRKLAAEVQALAPRGAKLYRQEPDQGKDWNDQLRDQVRQAERSRGCGMSR